MLFFSILVVNKFFIYLLLFSGLITNNMEKRIKSEQKFWNKVAKRYDRWIERAFEDQYIEYRAKITSYIKPNDVLLEIGTGTGDISFLIADKCKKVIGTDISPKMIEIANIKISNKNFKNLSFQVEDAYNLSFPDSYFDKIICCNAFQAMKDPINAIKEGKRVLKENGEFLSITYCFGDSGIFEQLKLMKWVLLYGMPRHWKYFTRKQLSNLFRNEFFDINEEVDVWKKPVALFLRCKK